MQRKTKQPISYFRFDANLARKLDRRIMRAGYQSRTEFFTAVAYVTLYGYETPYEKQPARETETVEKLPETVTTWIQETIPHISEEEILSGLHAVIAEMLFAVIAMKGVDVAYENTWEDVRAVFHSKSGVWVTESDVREAFESFAAVNRRGLEEYREKQMLEGDLKGER